MSGYVPPSRKCVKRLLVLALVVFPKRWRVLGGSVNQKRVWRVMRQATLTSRRKRRTVLTTDARYSSQVDPLRVKGLQVQAPKRCWVADLTPPSVARRRGLPSQSLEEVFAQMHRLEPVWTDGWAVASSSGFR